jgi:hypothetical protein
MGIKEIKLDLMQKLMTVNDSKLLKKVDKLLEEELIVGYTTDGKPLTINEYNERLEKAENQVNSGKFTSQAHLEKESENW